MEGKSIMKLQFYEVDYGKSPFLLHIAKDHNNGQLYKL
jgi:hypothetical protein